MESELTISTTPAADAGTTTTTRIDGKTSLGGKSPSNSAASLSSVVDGTVGKVVNGKMTFSKVDIVGMRPKCVPDKPEGLTCYMKGITPLGSGAGGGRGGGTTHVQGCTSTVPPARNEPVVVAVVVAVAVAVKVVVGSW